MLFVDASTIDLKKLLADRAVPARTLLIGLPLKMLLGTLVGWPLFPGIGIWSLLLMAFILSPTDAALGQAVVKSEKVPARVRRRISVESGLNDGIARPPIFACSAVLTLGLGGSDQHWGRSCYRKCCSERRLVTPSAGPVAGWFPGFPPGAG